MFCAVCVCVFWGFADVAAEFVVFLRHMPGWCLKLGHNPVMQHLSELIDHALP